MRRAVLALLLAIPLACEEPGREPVEVASTGPGAVLYLTYCESCHGVAGQGDGPAAGALRTPPPDLTRLWERYGTPLDRERLAESIDGRILTSFHALREMPIWGEEFFEDAPQDTPGLEGLRRHLIDVLIEHLQSLQGAQHT